MAFNDTFNNISALSWRSVLLVEETEENHQSVANHLMLYRIHLALAAVFELATLIVIGSDCTGSLEIQLPYDHDHDAS
jgi:hypothetical protein